MTRDEQLKDFFKRFDNMTEADAQEVQGMAFEIGVTLVELEAHSRERQEIDASRYVRSPF